MVPIKEHLPETCTRFNDVMKVIDQDLVRSTKEYKIKTEIGRIKGLDESFLHRRDMVLI